MQFLGKLIRMHICCRNVKKNALVMLWVRGTSHSSLIKPQSGQFERMRSIQYYYMFFLLCSGSGLDKFIHPVMLNSSALLSHSYFLSCLRAPFLLDVVKRNGFRSLKRKAKPVHMMKTSVAMAPLLCKLALFKVAAVISSMEPVMQEN